MSALPSWRPAPTLVTKISEGARSIDQALRRGHDLADVLLAGASSSRSGGPLFNELEAEAPAPAKPTVEHPARLESVERELSLIREENARLAGERARDSQSLREEMGELRSAIDSLRERTARTEALVERAIDAMEAIRQLAIDKSNR